jgi:hypothetical protein
MKYHLALFLFYTIISCQPSPSPKQEVTTKQIKLETSTKVQYEIDYSSDNSYSSFLNGLKQIHKTIKLKRDTAKNNYVCHISFKEYFSVFDKLKIDTNWVLESHYRHFGDAGRPLILGFQDSLKLSDSIKSILKLNFEGMKFQSLLEYGISEKLFKYQDSVDYLDAIHISDDNMGYFQFVIFVLIGDNYCKYGHSNYRELSIITSLEQLKKLAGLEDDFYYKFNKNQVEKILQLAPAPKIISNRKEVKIELLTCSPWGGFVKKKFSVSKSWPHKLKMLKRDTLLEYNCKVMF